MRTYSNGVFQLSSTFLGADAPASSFDALGLPDAMVRALRARGIVTPLPIQAATISDVLAGRDVAGKAPTGSGKTLAFGLPLATAVGRGAPRRPRALVLAPTRELAAQIVAELAPLLATRSRTCHPFYGGVGFGPQRQALRRGVDVAVACPGRLEDLIGRGDLSLSDVEIVVVDEADRMADMGFLPAVRRILDATTARRQTLLFSATLDGAVDVLVRSYQRTPVRHEVEAQSDDHSRVTHRFHDVAHADRIGLCADLLRDRDSAVVFVRTKHGADRVARQLTAAGVGADVIHGGRSQSQRERSLAAFRAGKRQALVATDVAARGIHVDDVSCVIHYDLPPDPKDYVHRSGRTGRAGATGFVDAFVTPDTRTTAAALRRALDIEIAGTAGVPTRAAQSGTRSGTRSDTRSGGPTPGGSGARARRHGSGSPSRSKGSGQGAGGRGAAARRRRRGPGHRPAER
ncbi:MAG TPA: DEAD/DEAH box helicase [Acidimicrobiales bacterium]|nr:DEAD/DEAH box helicase [Acidimicrobiales bacterium]